MRTRVIRLTNCVVAALALTAVVAAPTSAFAAGSTPVPRAAPAGNIGLRLVDVPVASNNDPRARIYVVDHVAPGTVVNRGIEIANTTSTTAHVVVYPAAATIANGSFLGAAGHTPNDLSTWTSVRPDAPDIPAGGRVTGIVTITVPADAAPGEQYGVVWAEAASAVAAGGVVQASRVGIRVYLSVGPGGAPAADFTIDSLTAKRSTDGRPTVLASVHNTGGRALDVNGSLQLLAGPEPVTIPLDKQLPAGPWHARINLRSGLLERDARATITFPGVGGSRSVSTAPARSAWQYAVIAGVVALAVGVAASLVVLNGRARRTRRRRPRQARRSVARRTHARRASA
jgi:hypothetical protein